MIDRSDSITINRPVDEVFAYVADTANNPAWHTDIIEARKTSDGPIGTGTTWHQRIKPFMGVSEATAEVVAFEPHRKEVLRGVAGPMQPTLSPIRLRHPRDRLRGQNGNDPRDFDVLAQLALAGGDLRMTELAARAFSSRSGMTRRVERLVNEGLVRRADADADARGVVVALTDVGVERLAEALPVHLQKVSELFVEPLDDHALAVLERALETVTQDCSFG